MKCTYCERTDIQDNDKPKQCMCYTWFVYTCTVCFVTLMIGISCCVYCTCLMLSINQTIQTHDNQVKSEVALQSNDLQDGATSQEYIIQKRSTHILGNFRTPSSQIRRKRNAVDKKKEKKKKRKGGKGTKKQRKGGKGTKKQRTQAAHYVLKENLEDEGANCPLGASNGNGPTELRQTLDVFKLASFIKAKSNPFQEIEGRFVANSKGLYLVYAQILFEDCRPQEVMRVVQKRKVDGNEVLIQEHFCIVGVPKAEKSYNNTCSMTSLFFLEQGDYLTVVNHYPEVHINLAGNGTFFGAILLR